MGKGDKNLRDKYKKQAPNLKELKDRQKEEDSQLGFGGGSDYLDINDGANKFRLFPAHEGNDFMLMRKQYWVDIPDEDGNPKRRTVPCSILHG